MAILAIPKRLRAYWLLGGAIILAGLALRLLQLGLPPLVVKYGGSALWAAMVYCIMAAFLPSRSARTVALVAFLIAALVELSRLFHTPSLDAFRVTRAGVLLLGRVFNPLHFIVYGLAIAVTAWFDIAVLRPPGALRG